MYTATCPLPIRETDWTATMSIICAAPPPDVCLKRGQVGGAKADVPSAQESGVATLVRYATRFSL